MANKLTITREQLTKWVSQLDSDGGCDATDRQLEALIRQSLATTHSEPVAWTDEEELNDLKRDGYAAMLSLDRKDCEYADPRRQIILYRQEQPARDSCAIADVIAERQRQQSVEGFSTEQDDTYVGCQLAAAAICYIEPMEAMSYWPADWHDDSFKPTNERRNLVKAAALIIAEIERIDRKSDAELKNE
ncbi:hypothetical protein AB9C21_12330 [Klebsiella michiganensis]|uniref:Phage EaA protein n=1 Tax=Klebsiella michiganensis TaxID=1134687 RepID=A0AAX3CPE1_9ENTR|nr:hypothetical protein [Klebsiella michiganensis]EJG2192891.1 hypothetical protein [Klebsiella oxytoca]PZU17024.1 MAG: hypothetical protein DI589_26595 [Shinella sp.]HBV5319288.1 hypothetical protein [Klebsiella pneumoniae]UWZ73630.1 hypothetical protein NP224_26215 [Klebsiella michiganensis]GKQ24786.1 hypothetical protein NUBL17187_25820 [Klebsiella michiganensis]